MDKKLWNKVQEIVGKGLRNSSFLNDSLGDYTEYTIEKNDNVVSHTIYFNGVELCVMLMQDSRDNTRFVVGYAEWVHDVFQWGGADTLDTDSDVPWDETLYWEVETLTRLAQAVVVCASYEHPIQPREFKTGTRAIKPTSRYSVYLALLERMLYELSLPYVEA